MSNLDGMSDKELEESLLDFFHSTEITQALGSSTSPDPDTSSLQALQQQVASVFMHGPLRAGAVFLALTEAAKGNRSIVRMPVCDFSVPWNSCKAAATLVAILASPRDKLSKALEFSSLTLGGQLTLATLHGVPSTSLPDAFRAAKQLARGKDKITTVMSVSLFDVHMFELAKANKSQHYTSFAHTFTLGIGPEGVIIWQSWGEHGYGLDQWLEHGGDRIRNWEEAGNFVDRFHKLTLHEGVWDAKRNKLYKQCFDVDVFEICGPSRPIVPKYKAWVRLFVLEDVKLEQIRKFTFRLQKK